MPILCCMESPVVDPIRTAVFPVGGLGARFLPATKALPKEMLPIVDKPLIQYAVEEAIAAGVTKLVFVTGSSKRAIEDHFDSDTELESKLINAGKTEMLSSLQGIVPDGVSCIYIRQGQPLGLGHAVLCSRPAVGNEPFFVLLADDLIVDDNQCLSQMATNYSQYGASVVAVQDVSRKETSSYGIVGFEDTGGRTHPVESIVEKPNPEDAPSTKAVVGRYLLVPEIFDHLERTPRGAGGEIQLTDAISALLADQPVQALRFEGKRFDCGSKLGYLQAMVEFGLCDTDVGEAFSAFLKSTVNTA